MTKGQFIELKCNISLYAFFHSRWCDVEAEKYLEIRLVTKGSKKRVLLNNTNI